MHRDKLIRFLQVIGIGLPIAILVMLVFLYHIDIPVWDSWEMVPLIQKSYEEGLTWTDFWQPHHGHRLVVSRTIILFIAQLSHWNTGYEVILNIVLALGIFLVTTGQIKQSLKINNAFLIILPIVSLIIFSLNQFENWLLGFTLHIFLHTFSVVLGIKLLTDPYFSGKKFAGVILCGLIATFTFATGLIYWWVILLLMYLNRTFSPQLRRNLIFGWVSVSLLITTLYLFQFTSETSSFWINNASNILNSGLFTLMYLGRPMTFFLYLDTFWGILVGVYALVTTSLMTVYLIKRKYFSKISPFIGYLVYAVGSGVIIAIGRSHLGVEAARPSRYITLSNLFWIAVLVIWYMCYQELRRQNKSSLTTRLLPVICCVFIVCAILSSLRSVELFQKYSQRFREERDSVLEYARTGKLTVFYHNAATMKLRIEILRKYKLSVFRE